MWTFALESFLRAEIVRSSIAGVPETGLNGYFDANGSLARSA
jgi:hypothetical protein